MSRGGGLPPLEGTDDESVDGWMSDTGNREAFVFARSGKMQRSPVKVTGNSDVGTAGPSEDPLDLGLSQLFTPKTSGRSQVVQQEPRSRVSELRRKVDELYDYIKTKHNVHQTIKKIVSGLKSGMAAAEREQQAYKERAETAEKELEKIVSVVTESSPNVRAGKRDRETPGEDEISKKQREDNGEKVDEGGENSGWQTMKSKNERKNKKKNEDKKEEEKKKEENKTVETKKPRQRVKGDALIVEVKQGVTYAELLRKVRADPELQELGQSVVKTRRTQKGELLFELKKDPAVKSSAFRQLVEKSLGEQANVRALSQETVVECKDLDAITTEDELREALKQQCGLNVDAQMVIRMRKAYGGTQTAAIRLSTTAANKLVEKGKIKVGWSVCHLKVAPRVSKEMERCFKCMGFGHHARNCAGPDRSKLCRKCGEEGHFANDCAKPAKCMLCTEQDGNGHVTGSFKCPEYKKAMAHQQ